MTTNSRTYLTNNLLIILVWFLCIILGITAVWYANFLASRSVCKASSRVGERIRQSGDGGWCFSGNSSAWYSSKFDIIGKRKAA